MNEIDSQLTELQTEAERLILQAEQEKAMAQVLPLNFANNISAFEQFIPNIADIFRNYKPQRAFRFFCTENGIPNLEWLDTSVSLYGDDPHSQCLEQITSLIETSGIYGVRFSVEKNFFNQIHVEYLNQLTELLSKKKADLEPRKTVPNSIPLVMMFGVGLGYQLGYLYERCQAANIYIFEPNFDLFYASLFTFDWASWLQYLSDENLGLHIFLGQDEKNLMDDLTIAINKDGPFLASNPIGFCHYPSAEIDNLVACVSKEFFLLSMGWGFFDDNMLSLSHSMANIESGIPFLYKDKKIAAEWQDIPVFVIGNGPSLDNALPVIRQYQDRAILISCGSSISALYKEGIRPDIYVAIERTKAVADFIALIDDEEYLKDILFLSTDVVHPACHRFFKRSALGFKSNEPMYAIAMINFAEARNRACLNYVNPLVGNIGLVMPLIFGFQNVYMFGLDNGYKDKEHHHSKHSAYYDHTGKPIAELQKMVVSGGDLRLPGNFGGTVTATKLFATSAKYMEKILSFYPEVNCLNCSDGVKVEGAKPLAANEVILNNVPINKQQLLDHIYLDLYAPLNITKSQVHEALDVNFFNQLIDKVLSEWDEPLLSRHDIVQRMSRQYGYIQAIANSRNSHITRFLIGTFNYLFSFIATFTYVFENETDALTAVDEALVIFREYLTKTKILYPKALDSADSVDCEIISFYRKN